MTRLMQAVYCDPPEPDQEIAIAETLNYLLTQLSREHPEWKLDWDGDWEPVKL